MYHLAWFLPQGFAMEPWTPAGRDIWEGHNATQWMKPDIYCELAQSIERAGFDFMLLEDTNEVDDTFRGSMEFTLRHGAARAQERSDAIGAVDGAANEASGIRAHGFQQLLSAVSSCATSGDPGPSDRGALRLQPCHRDFAAGRSILWDGSIATQGDAI